MRYGFALGGLCVACLLLADDAAQQKVQVSKTEKVDFPAGGTLRLQNSSGELIIEGWEQPGVEITTTKSSKDAYTPADRAKAMRDLDSIQVSTKRNGDELAVTTEFPHHRAFPYVSPLSVVTNFDLEYRIRVPRNAKVIVKHEDGEVHVDGVAGNVQVTARQGLITLRLAGETQPSIDAKSDAGSVISDFAGNETRRPWPFGHRLIEGTSAASQNLQLRIGFGDIVILKAHNPQTPRPVT
jgi:hypothetical protein